MEPSWDSDATDRLTDEHKSKGLAFIKEYIPDFDYRFVLERCTSDNLMERYSREQSSYVKMLILRLYVDQDGPARERLRNANDVLRKYVDETYHIENDYLYSLDVRRFNIVPDHYVADADQFVADERARLIDV